MRGGHLASIHSNAENAGVAGEPFNFTSWYVTEPNNAGGVPGEDRVEMPFTTGSVIGGTRWKDRNCDPLTACVCEDELWPTW